MPRNSSSLPDLPPETSGNRKPVGVYIIVYGFVVAMIVALLGILLAIPSSR